MNSIHSSQNATWQLSSYNLGVCKYLQPRVCFSKHQLAKQAHIVPIKTEPFVQSELLMNELNDLGWFFMLNVRFEF